MKRKIEVEYLGNHETNLFKLTESFGHSIAIRTQARELLKNVRSRAARRLRTRRRNAQNAGYRSGELAGQQRLLSEVREVERLYASTVKNAEEDCFRAVRDVAEAVVGNLAAESSSFLIERIRLALQRLIQKNEVRILISTGQADDCRSALGTALPGRRLIIEKSDAVAPGDAIICSPGGSIELKWRDQMASLLEQLKPTTMVSI